MNNKQTTEVIDTKPVFEVTTKESMLCYTSRITLPKDSELVFSTRKFRGMSEENLVTKVYIDGIRSVDLAYIQYKEQQNFIEQLKDLIEQYPNHSIENALSERSFSRLDQMLGHEVLYFSGLLRFGVDSTGKTVAVADVGDGVRFDINELLETNQTYLLVDVMLQSIKESQQKATKKTELKEKLQSLIKEFDIGNLE